jgi:ankyrin repeat protein
LCEAAECGHYLTTQFLLAAGGQPDFDSVDRTAKRGNVDILRLFIAHTPILRTARTPSGNLCMASAILWEQIGVIQFFVKEALVDINTADLAGQTAFHLAVESKNEEVVDIVINLGANVHALDASGQSAFERAVSYDSLIVDRLAQRIDHSSIGLRAWKILQARAILKSLRMNRLQQIASRVNNNKLTIEEKVESIHTQWLASRMDDKLLKI